MIIVEASRIFLSRETSQGVQITWDGVAMTQEGPKWLKNLDQNNKKWDQNDGPKCSGSEMAWVCFGKSWCRLSST